MGQYFFIQKYFKSFLCSNTFSSFFRQKNFRPSLEIKPRVGLTVSTFKQEFEAWFGALVSETF